MAIDLSNATPDAALNLLKGLPLAGAWTQADLKAVLAFLAASTGVLLPWGQFKDAGIEWARHPKAIRLLDAAADAFGASERGISVFEGARQVALARNDLALFEHLTQPKFAWNQHAQVEALAAIAQKSEARAASWHAAFWTWVPPADRAVLYPAVAQETGMTLWGALSAVLAFHATVPDAQTKDLVQGVASALWFYQVEREPDLGDDADILYAWASVRDQVDADAVMTALAHRVGEEAALTREARATYHQVCDLILADASPEGRAPWLARSELALPRARAAARQTALKGMAPPALPRLRRRS